jgi:hypothetical protein
MVAGKTVVRLAVVTTLLLSISRAVLPQDASRPLTPSEALAKVDQKVSVLMEVRSTGGNTARYLNSEADFRGEKNFAVFIPNVALAAFKQAGVEDPGKHFYGKTILVTGTVAVAQHRPQIRVENPSQIKIVIGGAAPAGPVGAVKRPGK